MGKKPYYAELIEDIVAEEYGNNASKLQQELLDKFSITESKTETKKVAVDTKELLMVAIRAFGASSLILDQIISKLEDNQKVLASEHQHFMVKLAEFF